MNIETRLTARATFAALALVALIAATVGLEGCSSANAAQPPAAPLTATVAAVTDPCAVETGSFPLTATGFSGTAPTGTALYKYFPCANMAMLFLPGLAGTSNDTSFTAGPLPSFLIPVTLTNQQHELLGYDNGVEQSTMAVILQAGSSTLTYSIHGDWTGWTPSGNKGVGLQVVTVFLD